MKKSQISILNILEELFCKVKTKKILLQGWLEPKLPTSQNFADCNFNSLKPRICPPKQNYEPFESPFPKGPNFKPRPKSGKPKLQTCQHPESSTRIKWSDPNLKIGLSIESKYSTTLFYWNSMTGPLFFLKLYQLVMGRVPNNGFSVMYLGICQKSS